MTTPHTPVLDGRQLIPHEPPMAMIGPVVEHGPTHLVCEVTPGAVHTLFVHDEAVSAVVGLEYMAQAVAAFAGLYSGDNPKQLGYLIGVKNLVLHTPRLAVGIPLRVRVEHVWGDHRLGQFSGHVHRETERLVEATMTVFRPGPQESL